MDAKVQVGDGHEDYWKAMKVGDGKALEKLYQQFANPLYNYGSKFTTDNEQVRECIQSLFVTLWISRANLGVPANIKNYLFKAIRLAIFKNAKVANAQDSFDQNGQYNFLATLSIEDKIIIEEDRFELQQRLQSGLDQLSPRQREAIFLRFYEGMDYVEIAEVMDISTKGTYKLMARAINVLRDKLDKGDFSMLFLMLGCKLFS